MPQPPVIGRVDPELAKRITLLLDLADAGQWRPDPVTLAWAMGVLIDRGELAIAVRCERLLRRIAPSWRRNLT